MDAVTIASLVLGVLGVLAAVVTYWLSRRPKQLGFVFDQWIKLLSEAYPEIEVTHRGIPVPNPYYFEIRFKNFGKVEIRSEDFVANEPLTVMFNNADVVDASVKVSRRGQVHTATENKGNCIQFEPVLINPGEEVVLAGIASSAESRASIEISGRIAGVADILPLAGSDRLGFLDELRVFIPIVSATLILFIYGLATDQLLSILSLGLFCLLCAARLMSYWWHWRRIRR